MRKTFTYTTSGNKGRLTLNGDHVSIMIPRSLAHPPIDDTLPYAEVAEMVTAFKTGHPDANGMISGDQYDWAWGFTNEGEPFFTLLQNVKAVPLQSQLRVTLVNKFTALVDYKQAKEADK